MNKLQQRPVNFKQALALVKAEAEKFICSCEITPLDQALNKALAEDIIADTDKPQSANSSMDGFCVNSKDLARASAENPVRLPVVAGIDAGYRIENLPEGHCAYIATGAPLPSGADAIERLENVPEGHSATIATFTRPVEIGNFVREPGAEQKKGQKIAAAGATLTPHLIGVAASAGLSTLKVKKPPLVGILTSGDELVMPWEQPKPWQVRNGNSLMLYNQVIEAGARPIDFGIARDNEEDALKLFLRAVDQSDILVTSGGISMGRKDPFRNIFAALKIEPVVYGVTMKPGKPFFFGYYQNKPVFALPGNVVSTAVTFELFVRTFIKIALQLPPHRLQLKMKLSRPSHNSSKRDFFERGRLVQAAGETLVEPIDKQESHMLSGFTATDLLYLHPAGIENLEAGTVVDCIILRNESS